MLEDPLYGDRLARKDGIGAGYISQSPIRRVKNSLAALGRCMLFEVGSMPLHCS